MNKSDFHELMAANINSDRDINVHFINSTRIGGVILKVLNDCIIFSGKNDEHFNAIPISSILTLEFNPPARS